MPHWIKQTLFIVVLIVGLVACATADEPTNSSPENTPLPEPTHVPATLAEIAAPTQPPEPTPTQQVTATPLPTPIEPTSAPPTPIPADARDYELCVSIASDSNGYGHVTFQRPDTGQVAITYITPLALPLQSHLNARGLDYLTVIDHSQSAGGLTIATSNYLESDQYFLLKQDKCKFVIITPFYPDVAVNLSDPEFYVENMNWLLQGIKAWSPESRLLVLNYYQANRADFVVDNMGRGVTEARINAFNAAIAEGCSPGGILAQYDPTCVDISGWFDDLGVPHVLAETTFSDYQAALYKTTSFTPIIDAYFAENPDGTILGDGVHLSLAGRDRLAERLAEIIAEMNDDF